MSLFEEYQKSRSAVNGQTPGTGGNTPAPSAGNTPTPSSTGSLYSAFQEQRNTTNKVVAEDTTTNTKVDNEVGKLLKDDVAPKDTWFSKIKSFNQAGVNILDKTYGAFIRKTGDLFGGVLYEGIENIKDKPFTPTEIKGATKELGLGIKNLGIGFIDFFTKQAPKAITTGLSLILDNTSIGVPTFLGIGTFEPEIIKKGRKKAADFFDDVTDYIDQGQQQDQKDLGLEGAGILDPQKFGYTIGSGAGSIATAIATGMASKSSWVAGTILGWIEGSDTYNEAKEKLMGQEMNKIMFEEERRPTQQEVDNIEDIVNKKAAAIAIVDSAGIAVLEKVGLDFLTRSYGGSWLTKRIINATSETMQEDTQAIWSHLVGKYGYNKEDDLITELVETTLTMPFLGMFGGGGAEMIMDGQIVDDVAKKMKMETGDAKSLLETVMPVVDDIVKTDIKSGKIIEDTKKAKDTLNEEIKTAVDKSSKEEVKEELKNQLDVDENEADTLMEEALKQWTEPAGDEVMAEIKAAEDAVDAWDAKVEDVKAKNEAKSPTKEKKDIAPVAVSTDIQDTLAEMENDPEVLADWEDNYAENVGNLADKVSNLEKQLKTAKGEQKAKLTSQITDLNSQIDAINTEFTDKYEKIAKEKANKKIQEEVANVEEKAKTTKKKLTGPKQKIADYESWLETGKTTTGESPKAWEGDRAFVESLLERAKKEVAGPVEFKTGDTFDTQGNTNMADPITVTDTKGNTLKFTDSKGKEYSGMSKSTVRNLLENESWKKLDKENEQVDNKEYGRDTKNTRGDIQSGTDTGSGKAGGKESAGAGEPSAKRGKRVARGESDTSSDGTRERSEQDLIEEVAKDSIEKQEATGYSNEAIQALVEAKTTIGEDGEVTIIDKISDRELEIANSYTPAGGKEKQGAEGRALLDEYYTPTDVVDMTSSLLGGLGIFTDDMKVLEPSVGIGAFLSNVPAKASVDAFEINEVTARIAKLNNQDARVVVQPLESVFVGPRGEKKSFTEEYDLVLGNPPYGAHRGKYKGMGEEANIDRYEEYFIKRTLDLTKEGGHVAMVVPSGFLRSPANKAKRAINEIAELVVAYRLPNGAFPTTDIGTDIVIFKKNTQKSKEAKILNVQTISDDYYFRDVMNAEKVLGENTTKKGRFGLEPFVKGDMSTAMELFYNAQGQDYAETVTDDPEIEQAITEELQDTYKPEVYKEIHTKEEITQETSTNEPVIADSTELTDFTITKEDLNALRSSEDTIEVAGKEYTAHLMSYGDYYLEPKGWKGGERDGHAPSTLWLEVADAKTQTYKVNKLLSDITSQTQETKTETAIEKKARKKAEAKNKKSVIETSKKTKGRLNLSTFSTATKEDAKLWEYVTPTGELDGDFDTTGTFYSAGRYYNKFNYLQGDIYGKLEQLEEDKGMISAEQYAMQKKALEDIKPEIVNVDRMSVSPNSKFVHDLKLGEHSLADNFMKWIRELPRTALGNSSTYAIRGYVQNQAVRGGDKLQNEQERRTRRIEADRLFKLYLKDELNAEQQKIVEDAYNKQFNAYARPDYRGVPLAAELHDTFNGKKLDVREVQLQGVGFLVNRGVGLLAHDVGVGKTMQAIIANAEMLKRGWAKKPLIVVPSVSVYNQWVKEIQELIPDVTINLLENLGGDFKGDLKTLEIKEGTLSIITDEGFKRLGFKDETYNELTKDFYDVINNPNGTKRAGALEEAKAGETIGKGMKGTRFDRYFEDLGFDLITADEVHNYNHIVSSAKMDKGQVSEFRGFKVQPSLAGIKMWLATQYILKNNNGRNVFLLSATPFTNNPLEYYSILSLMARDRMQRMGLTNVNDFMTMFMEITSKAEFRADGQYVEKSEVRGFKNYQQFQKLLTEFIDFRDGVEAGVKRPIREAREYVVGETKEAFDYKTQAQELFKDTKHAGALKAINELRAVAFSPYLSRYYDGAIPTATQLVENSPKIKATVELIKQTLKDNPAGGHLIYSTVGVEYFPLIKEYLEKNVTQKGQVEIISGMTPKNKRAGIQEDFNSGKLKVIIGSDAIQEGVNLQKNTTDLYILSLPWNFTSLRQVIGRAWRQGNQWPKLRINNVFTENSIDTFLSQKLQNKETRYEESLKFKGDNLDVGDIDFEALKFDLITDPVTRTELEYKFKQQELETEMKRKESEFAYQNRRADELIEAREQVTRYEEYLKDEEDPENSWAFARFQDAKKNLIEVEAKLKDRGLNVEEITKDIEKSEKEIAGIKAQIENLSITKEDAMKKALDQRAEGFDAPTETNYKKFTADREEDNKTFFDGGPGYEKNYTSVPKAKRASLTSQTMQKLMGNKPAFLKADLSTVILNDLKDKTVVSQQYILDSVKRDGIKKAEKELMLEALAEMPEGKEINVEMFGSKVVGKLLPLNVVDREMASARARTELEKLGYEIEQDMSGDANLVDKNGDLVDLDSLPESVQKLADEANGGAETYNEIGKPRYESVSLQPDERGDVAEYKENIYESPIKTMAGSVHFNGVKNYFAHTRIEDMEDIKTRRVIELQSDLFQKGRLEEESGQWSVLKGDESMDSIGAVEFNKRIVARKLETLKLEPYRNTWHERIIREEIKQAAKDGKTTLLFPTGKTAMMVEGLGESGLWGVFDTDGELKELKPDMLNVGMVVTQDFPGAIDWVITEVLDGGKFKAIPKKDYELALQYYNEQKISRPEFKIENSSAYNNRAEIFDVSGTVDKTNPIYKFYESEVYKYLRKIRPDLQRITDARGVEWFETKITENDFNQPVLAFKKPLFSSLEGPKITIEEAKKLIFAEIPEKDVKIIFNPDLIKEKGILGEYRDALNPALKPVIELYTEGGYTSATTAYHEAGHYIFNNIVDQADKENVIKIAKEDMSLIRKGTYKIAGYTTDEVAEEYIMDEYANYKASKAGYESRMTWFFHKLDAIFKDIVEKAKLIKARINQFIDDRGGPEGGFIRPFAKSSDIDNFDLSNKQIERDRIKQENLDNIIKDIAPDEDSQNRLRKDINSLESFTAQARDLYLKDPNEFEAANSYEKIGDSRRMKKEVLDNKYSKILKPYFTLAKNSQEKVNKVLMAGDEAGKEYSVEDLQLLNLNAEDIKAYQAVRKAFNIAHELLLSEMAKNGVAPEEIDEFRQTRIGYMPHKWKYKYVIKTKALDSKGKWKTETMDAYKTEREAKRVYDSKVSTNVAPGSVKYELDTLDSLEVDFFSEQKLSFEAMKSVISQAKTSDDIKKNMIGAVRNMIKEKGFGRNYIKRTGVRGYELKEIPKIMADYFAGLNGFVTKMEAGKQYYDILSTIDARRQSKFYEWIRNAIAYDMGNQQESISLKIPFTSARIDLKQMAFIYYLANDLSFLITNSTQNIVIGVGELSKYMTGKQKLVGPEVALTKATVDWALKRVTKSERAVIDGLISLGELGGEMASELMGFKNNPMYAEISNRFSKIMYASTALVEKNVNRVPAFLAARRTLIEQGMDEKQANEKALEISNDIHFRYGKQNRPEFMRGKKGVFFIFNHYIRSLMYQLYRDLSRKEFAAFARKMMWTTVLGGAKALPFASLLVILFRKFYHDDDDKEGEEEMSKWMIAIQRGIPAATIGIDMSSRVGIELMSINSIIEKPGDIKSYIGAAGNLFWVNWKPEDGGRLQRGFELLQQGRIDDAFGQILPDFAGNPLKAYAGYNWGVRSFAGTPLEDADGDVFKYTAWEAIVKGSGFTPTRESILWDQKSREWAKMDLVTAEKATVRRKIIGQIQRGDMEGARQTQSEAVMAGTITADTDYILKYGKDTFVSNAYKQWESSDKTSTDRKRIQKSLVEELYGSEATDAQKNNANRAFAVVRTFGDNNKDADLIESSGTNAEKVDNLRRLKEKLSEEEFSDFMKKARKEITLESGRTSRLLVTDGVLEDFNKVKNTPFVENSGSTSIDGRGPVGLASDYIEAFQIDPQNALKAMFTKEKLGVVQGNLVELQRFYGIKFDEKGGSQEYKRKRMEEMGLDWNTEKGNYKLEHITPVKAGGDSSDDNLLPVNNALHNMYTPIDIAVINAVKLGIITRKQATSIMVDLKIKKTLQPNQVYLRLK